MIFRKLQEVAPPSASPAKPAPEDTVWHLTLDQIESGSGQIVSRLYGPASKAGSSTFAFDNGNVLYSKLRPYLNKVICPDTNGIATTELVPLRPNPSELNREFLCSYLRSPEFVSWASSQVDGAKMPRMKMKAFWGYEIPLPPLDDQKRIAHLLGKVEGLIARRKQHLQQLDDLLKSVFLEMFGDPVRNEKGWDYIPLDNHIVHLTSGARGWAKYYSEAGKRFIRSLDVQMNHIGDDDIAYVNPPSNAEAERTRVAEGDVLLTITGSKIGRVCFVPNNFEVAYISQHVAIIRTDGLNPVFLSYYLSAEHSGQRQIKKHQYGQAKPGLNLTQIREFQIPVVNPEVQNQFAAIVEKVEGLKSRYQQSLTDLESLYGALSQKAFKGELDLSRVVLPIESTTEDTDSTEELNRETREQREMEII